MADIKRRHVTTGTEKAAKLLMVLGEERAAGVLRRLSSDVVQKIGLEMTRMGGMTTEEVNSILNAFLKECETNEYISIVADEYTKKVLVQALGPDAAESILEKILLGGNTKGLDSLRWMDPQLIAGIIQHEHPQIQALVVSYLQPEQAGDVLRYLPESLVIELIIRMAEMESVDPKALQELNYSLEKQVEGVVTKQSSAIGGVKSVANIFNTLERSLEDNLMKRLAEHSPGLDERIQELMFVFEDLTGIPNKDFQLLLREITTDKLALALKGADQALMNKVTSNMSVRAAEIFIDDMENMGPVKVTDVEMAQKEILAIAKQMSDTGQIVLSENNTAMIG
jgi:flagellar motor switch protein FliG